MRWSTLTGLGLGAVGVALFAKGMRACDELALTEATVSIPELPAPFDGFRLLHLTDLHFRRRSPRIAEVLALVDQVDPDLVCLTGDYAFTALSLPEVATFFDGLSHRQTVAVYGNADYRPGISTAVREAWARQVPFLANTALCLQRGGASLWVAGVDDPHLGRDSVMTALSVVPPDAPTLLLAHSPEVILRSLDPRVRLILSGHTHGGQICLPNGRALYHNTALPATFAAGRHTVGKATLYVSRGVGATRLPLRFGCPPECTVFTLSRDGEESPGTC